MSTYYKNNKQKMTKTARRWVENHPQQHLWTKCKRNAKVTGKKFDILPEDIVIPVRCPILGLKLTNKQGKGRMPATMSVDRINNKRGYVRGNIQVISFAANQMKGSYSKTLLIKFAKGILKHYVG